LARLTFTAKASASSANSSSPAAFNSLAAWSSCFFGELQQFFFALHRSLLFVERKGTLAAANVGVRAGQDQE
jgi:hypothetical protein